MYLNDRHLHGGHGNRWCANKWHDTEQLHHSDWSNKRHDLYIPCSCRVWRRQYTWSCSDRYRHAGCKCADQCPVVEFHCVNNKHGAELARASSCHWYNRCWLLGGILRSKLWCRRCSVYCCHTGCWCSGRCHHFIADLHNYRVDNGQHLCLPCHASSCCWFHRRL